MRVPGKAQDDEKTKSNRENGSPGQGALIALVEILRKEERKTLANRN